jgi:hypothetical protein
VDIMNDLGQSAFSIGLGHVVENWIESSSKWHPAGHPMNPLKQKILPVEEISWLL